MLYHMGIANILKISKSSVENHLHYHGYVNCFDIWVPHKLRKKKTFLKVFFASDFLLKHNENVLFLKHVVTGDDNWILYNNVGLKIPWGKQNELSLSTPKASLHPKKVMMCLVGLGGGRGVLYYELLPENQMINSASTAPN